MTSTTLRATVAVLLTFAVATTSTERPLLAQTAAPKPQTKPAPRRGGPAPAAQKPAPPPAAPKPAPPPAEDVRFKTIYTTGDQRTESVTYVKGPRERFEFQDMVLLRQHDQKRVVQISRAANTYLVAPADALAAGATPAADPSQPAKAPGIVAVTTTIVDTGERKAAFGREARRVKTIIERQPSAGACDTSKQRVETDGWYIDGPKALSASQSPSSSPAAPAGSCNDQVNASHNGDPKALGFPIAYTSTITGEDGKPSVVSMEITEFELTTLDAALFEIPQGLNAAMNIGELGKALSDAQEAKLAAANGETPAAPPARTPGVVRIGVPELTNKTTTPVDTRALRADLVDALIEAKYEAVPLAAASPAELQKRAADNGLDYLLLAEVTELKVSKGGFGGMMRAASKVAAGGGGAPQKDPTEASVAIKLVQPDGKQRLSTTAKGKDGSGFSLKTGLSLARFAGGMYMSMFMGPQMMSRMYRFNGLAGANLGGFGMLGNPALFQMQSMGMGLAMGGGGRGLAIDQTAGAASFIMQQAMAMNSSVNMGTPGGPSFAESLGEAVDNSAKAVAKALPRK